MQGSSGLGPGKAPNFNPKAFYPVQPSSADSMFGAQAPARWDQPPPFTHRFAQLGIAASLEKTSPLTESGKQAVKDVAKYVGKLCFHDESLGTAILLNKDYLLVPRHCIEGRLIDRLHLDISGNEIKCMHVVEENAELDYAVVKIAELSDIIPVQFTYAMPNDTILLHHPLGGGLTVSGHSKMQETEQARIDDLASVSHDSDSCSSGGAYIDSDGRIAAIHLGSDVNPEGYSRSAIMGTGSAERYALPIKNIADRNPNSILMHLNESPRLETNILFLDPIDRVVDWEREGYQSQLKFTQLLKANGVDLKAAKIGTNKNGAVSFSDAAVVSALETKYPTQFKAAVDFSLGQAGLHRHTKQYSIIGKIQSDHPLPFDVWKTTTNPKLKSIAKGSGSRPGENNMPAITIPEEKHQLLKSTGSSNTSKQFRADLTAKCNAGNIQGAIADVIQDYKDNNLLGATAIDPKYKVAWIDVLDIYVNMNVISAAEKTTLTALL